MMSDPRCTGPFSDARDCPVHRPVSVEQVNAHARVVEIAKRIDFDQIVRVLERQPGYYGRLVDEVRALMLALDTA